MPVMACTISPRSALHLVDLLELQADQPSVAELGQRADQLRATDFERDAVISPGLGDVIQ